MYGVKLVLHELAYGKRVIVTNLALNMGGLNEYMQKEYPFLWDSVDSNFSLHERIRILTDEETATFWTVRGHYDAGITMLSKEDWQRNRKPTYAGVADNGVFYCIDEVHNFFNARAWMETGRDVLFYLSQHRKLGDTVICVTQAVENVDKQFRSVTQDFTYLRNLSKEKMGLFTLPAIFTRKTYGAPATNGGSPVETGTFKLDVRGIGQCYDTAKGVGIHSTVAADKGERKSGIKWYWLAIGLPLVLMMLAWSIPKVGAYYFTKPMKKPVADLQKMSQEKPELQATQVVARVEVGKKESKERRIELNGERVEISGRDNMFGKGWRLLLTDGRIVSEGDGHLQFLTKDLAIIDGKVYHNKVLRSVTSERPSATESVVWPVYPQYPPRPKKFVGEINGRAN